MHVPDLLLQFGRELQLVPEGRRLGAPRLDVQVDVAADPIVVEPKRRTTAPAPNMRFASSTISLRSRSVSLMPSSGTADGSQRAQIVRHVAELADERGISELAGGRIARSAERERAGAAGFARECLRTHDGGVGARALHRLAGGDPIVRHDERKRDGNR
jgi:hypothetical protein